MHTEVRLRLLIERLELVRTVPERDMKEKVKVREKND